MNIPIHCGYTWDCVASCTSCSCNFFIITFLSHFFCGQMCESWCCLQTKWATVSRESDKNHDRDSVPQSSHPSYSRCVNHKQFLCCLGVSVDLSEALSCFDRWCFHHVPARKNKRARWLRIWRLWTHKNRPLFPPRTHIHAENEHSLQEKAFKRPPLNHKRGVCTPSDSSTTLEMDVTVYILISFLSLQGCQTMFWDQRKA